MEAPWTCCQTWFVRIGKDYQENKCFTIFTLFYFTEATWFKESDWSEVDNKNHRWKKLIRAISSSSAALVHVACMQFHRFYEFFFPFISLQPVFCFIFLLLSLQLSYPPSICQLSHHASIFTISFPFLLIWNQRLNEKNIRIVISHWLTFLHELFFLLTVESSAWCLELSCLRHCELINEWHSLSPAPRISLSSRRMVLIGLVKNKPRLAR